LSKIEGEREASSSRDRILREKYYYNMLGIVATTGYKTSSISISKSLSRILMWGSQENLTRSLY